MPGLIDDLPLPWHLYARPTWPSYDQLYEAAVETADRECAVLPYEPVRSQARWLLKLHGSLDHPEDIVLTRNDYLGLAERAGALFGILQAMLMTRHMLFVGY